MPAAVPAEVTLPGVPPAVARDRVLDVADVLLIAAVAGGHVATDEDGRLALTEKGKDLAAGLDAQHAVLTPAG